LCHVSACAEEPPLYPGEEAALSERAVPRRRLQYALGRTAARDALAGLGQPPAAIRRGEGGQPVWPDGIVGAISHSHADVVAVAGRRADYRGLGVDVEELDRKLDARIARMVARPSEMAWVNPVVGLDRLIMLFSAKEAVFKALYPVDQVWFGFADAELAWRADRQCFEAELLRDLGREYHAGLRLEITCTLGPNWVASTAYVPA
jgi:4'-phosphopantetheinyl transferase EntD